MFWKGFIRAGLVVLAVGTSIAASVQCIGTPGAVILAGDDEPTRPKLG